MKNYYKILKQKFTDKEIAESFILPSDLSKKEQKKADKEFSEFLKNRKRLSYNIIDNGYIPLSYVKNYYYKFSSVDMLSLNNDKEKEILIDSLVFEFKLALQQSLYGGCWGHSEFTEFRNSVKSEFENKQLENLTKENFNFLKSSGLLWVVFPEAPENWDEIK